MSKKSKRRDQRASPLSTANPSLLISRLTAPLPAYKPKLNLIEDRRLHHPDKNRSALTTSSSKHHLKVKTPKVIRGPNGRPMKSKAFNPARPFASLPHAVGFASPKRIVVCLKRAIRKEVIFAKNLTGKGSRSKRSRNSWSSIKC